MNRLYIDIYCEFLILKLNFVITHLNLNDTVCRLVSLMTLRN